MSINETYTRHAFFPRSLIGSLNSKIKEQRVGGGGGGEGGNKIWQEIRICVIHILTLAPTSHSQANWR